MSTAYIPLARKYRPPTFAKVVGQEHVTVTLKRAVLSGRAASAYLFCGPRGVGKTTIARILAKALNCEDLKEGEPCGQCTSCMETAAGTSLDVLEIDGASNTGVEDVRQLRETVKLHSAGGRFKVYIIDEVHMLSDSAFNALLKTLEEPPPHVRFVFATTAPQKVLATVVSRCQRFDFSRLTHAQIVAHLQEIAGKEEIPIRAEALHEIARVSEGSLRDALSLLDQMYSFAQGEIGAGDVASVVGVVDRLAIFELGDVLIGGDPAAALTQAAALTEIGREPALILGGLLQHWRDLMIATASADVEGLVSLPDDQLARLKQQAERCPLEECLYILNVLTHAHESARRSTLPRIPLDLALVKIARREQIVSVPQLLAELRGGITPQTTGAAVPARPRANPDSAPKSVPAPPPAPRPASKTQGLQEIQESWPEYLNRLGKVRASFSSYLAEAHPVALEDGVLTVALDERQRFHKETLEGREEKTLLEKLAAAVFGGPVKLKFDLRSDLPSSRKSSQLLESTVKMFQGQILGE
ncbi:MAG: DNA polymerase III subunit gamma/tau [Candidatus Omnitrophica bacterium]|nr:DNA polymerase III subunit gamma/tau [Candidatus Omnitrophota bacterium]